MVKTLSHKKMKQMNLLHKLLGLCAIILPLLIILFQMNLKAYADTPSSQKGDASQITITAHDLNVRESSNISSKIIGLVHQGDLFRVLQTQNNWDQIPLSNNLNGWVSGVYTQAVSSVKATITVPDLNVREAPDSSSQIIGLVHRGDTYNILQSVNHWDQIKLSNNQMGWVSSDYLAKGTSPENIMATVEAPVLNVRENPDLSSQVIGQLNWGSKLTIHEEQDGWAKIMSSSGVQGWVYEYYISKDTRTAHDTNLVTQPPSTSKSTSEAVNNSRSSTNKKSRSRSTTKSSNTSNLHSPTQSNKSQLVQQGQDSLDGKTIVLDPGHGGKDEGTTSNFTGTHEKTLTLATALDVEQKLKSAGAHVIMTRTTDTFIPLEQRAYISNQNHPDAFISFHYNWSSDPSANGIVDFYYQESRDDHLASDILNEVTKATGLQNDGTRFDDLDVLRNNTEPCTLIELGFLSNQHDDSVVESTTYRDQVAQGVYLGLLDYFSNQK